MRLETLLGVPTLLAQYTLLLPDRGLVADNG